MSTKTTILLGATILIVSLIIFFYPSKETEITPIQESPAITNLQPQPQGITLEQLSQHSTKQDCWIIYNNKVYDYTNAKIHPAMEETFYAHCGKTTGFQEGAISKHGARGSETRAESYGTYIGDLA